MNQVREKQRVLEQLENTDASPEMSEQIKQLWTEIDTWLDGEELHWKQWSKVPWLHEVDKKSMLFHVKAMQRQM